jgi:hypothetical protein
MSKVSPLRKITIICVISGLIAGILVNVLFWLVFPSAWFFLIIPAIMGWSIDHYAKIPKDVIQDDEMYNKLSKRAAYTCAAAVLLFFLLTFVPIIIIFPIQVIIENAMFYIVGMVCVYIGYTRGQRCITDAYFDSVLENK